MLQALVLIKGEPARRMLSRRHTSLPRNPENPEFAPGIAEVAQIEKGLSQSQLKSTSNWQDALWKKWPALSDWPGYLDVYESAAFLRVSPDTIRRALVTGRDGRARLPHQRAAGTYRIFKDDLQAFGRVPGRS